MNSMPWVVGEKKHRTSKRAIILGVPLGHWSGHYVRDIGKVVLKTRKAMVI